MRYIILIITSCILLNCSSKKSKSPDLIIKFFDKYQNEGSDVAIDFLFSTNKWTKDSEEQIESTKTNLKNTIKLLGKFHGYELISSIKVSNNLVHIVYLAKYDRQPLRFSFTLYRPNLEWQIQNFNYDYRILEELKEASKLKAN